MNDTGTVFRGNKITDKHTEGIATGIPRTICFKRQGVVHNAPFQFGAFESS